MSRPWERPSLKRERGLARLAPLMDMATLHE